MSVAVPYSRPLSPQPGVGKLCGAFDLDMFITDVADDVKETSARQRVESLMVAASQSDPDAIRELISEGVDVDSISADGSDTALGRAAAAGALPCVELLLDHRASVDKGEPSPLLIASMAGDMPCARLLIQRGANIDATDKNGFTALVKAVQGGNSEFVELLLARGAKLAVAHKNRWSALSIAMTMWRPRVSSRPNFFGGLLDALAANGMPTPGGWTLEEKADVDAVTLAAAAFGLQDLLPKLLRIGADINTLAVFETNLRTVCPGQHIVANSTPLHMAAEYGRAACVEYLIERGADVTKRDDCERTPFHACCQGGSKACIELVANTRGCDVTATDSQGRDGRALLEELRCRIDKQGEERCPIAIESAVEGLKLLDKLLAQAEEKKQRDAEIQRLRSELQTMRASVAEGGDVSSVHKQASDLVATIADGACTLKAEALLIRARCNIRLNRLAKARKDVAQARALTHDPAEAQEVETEIDRAVERADELERMEAATRQQRKEEKKSSEAARKQMVRAAPLRFAVWPCMLPAGHLSNRDPLWGDLH